MKKSANGFTIVELLIVIVVIGILATVALVAYGTVQARASSSGVKSELGQLGKKIQMYYVDTGSYPTTHAHLESLSWKASHSNYQQTTGGNLLYCSISTGQNARFAVAARAKDNTAFVFYSTGGIQTWTGSWSGAWATDCPNYGIPTSGEAGMVFSQGYHPPTWGTPGWRVWTGGIVP